MATKPFDNVMLDLETLGRKPGCIVLSIGAVKFRADGSSKLGDTHYSVVSEIDCAAHGLTTDTETLAWWNAQTPAAKEVLKQAGLKKAPTLKKALFEFSQFCASAPNVKVWGNSASFDCGILQAAYDAVKLPLPWKFWNERCYRTLSHEMEFATGKADRSKGTHHNALDDAVAQAKHACKIFKAMKEYRAWLA